MRSSACFISSLAPLLRNAVQLLVSPVVAHLGVDHVLRLMAVSSSTKRVQAVSISLRFPFIGSSRFRVMVQTDIFQEYDAETGKKVRSGRRQTEQLRTSVGVSRQHLSVDLPVGPRP